MKKVKIYKLTDPMNPEHSAKFLAAIEGASKIILTDSDAIFTIHETSHRY